jgi:uncharacterized protein
VRVPITGLVDHPGETRAFDAAVDAEEFGGEPWGPAEGRLEDPVLVDLHLDAVVEGVLVRGTLGFTLELPCARCLAAQRIVREVEVAELFVDPAKREEDEEPEPGYELVDDRTAIDLSTMARDALLIDLPVRVLCREDCQGLCPRCGADRNVVDCGHQAGDEPDPRWNKLADLDLPTE